MSKNTGTLVGAPIRVNDSQDTYPSAIDNEIKGGLHSVATDADRDAITADRRSAGMECYVIADEKTFKLKNDLVTWEQIAGANDGTGSNVQLISGNFGEWTALDNLSEDLININFVPAYKSDLQAFPTRAITYVQGQFGIYSGFSSTTILIGTLPENSRPANEIRKYFIFQNIEMFLVIGTDGNVSLVSKDDINLPVTTGTPEVQPYYIDIFFNPTITIGSETTYTATRTATFTRNNCGSGQTGSSVSFTKTYTSTVDQATADNLAATDANFNTDGQAWANDPANGATCSVPEGNVRVINNSPTMSLINCHISTLASGGLAPGQEYDGYLAPGTYTVIVKAGNGPGSRVGCNGEYQQSEFNAQSYSFIGVSTPILVDLEDYPV